MDLTIDDIDRWRVRRLAYWLWRQRGSPDGSPDDDWMRAEEILGVRSRRWELPAELPPSASQVTSPNEVV